MEHTSETESPERWLGVRDTLRQRRSELSEIAAMFYPQHERVAGTSLLSYKPWLPDRPLDIDEIKLEWLDAPIPFAVTGTEPSAEHVRAMDSSGHRLPSYAASMEALTRPAVFENRLVYRVTDADLTGEQPRMTFCRGRYFDGVNVGEALGHELAAAAPGNETSSLAGLPLRTRVGDPCELRRRSATLAVSVLTVRHDRRTGEATCILHWRDPAKVAHAGGLHQVMPVGVFQPSTDSTLSEEVDFDLWRGIVREYAEEFLGGSETYDDPIDYERWSLHRDLTRARNAGYLKISCLGVGVDPVTFAVDLLVAAVFDADLFDSTFRGASGENDEGQILGRRLRLDPDRVGPFLATVDMQPAGQAALKLALRERHLLLT